MVVMPTLCWVLWLHHFQGVCVSQEVPGSVKARKFWALCEPGSSGLCVMHSIAYAQTKILYLWLLTQWAVQSQSHRWGKLALIKQSSMSTVWSSKSRLVLVFQYCEWSAWAKTTASAVIVLFLKSKNSALKHADSVFALLNVKEIWPVLDIMFVHPTQSTMLSWSRCSSSLIPHSK